LGINYLHAVKEPRLEHAKSHVESYNLYICLILQKEQYQVLSVTVYKSGCFCFSAVRLYTVSTFAKMPFLGQDWRGPGHQWKKSASTSTGWEIHEPQIGVLLDTIPR